MVCPRCVSAVRNLLLESGLNVENVELGKAYINGSVEPQSYEQIAQKLKGAGFELLADRDAQLIALIKAALVNLLHTWKNESFPVHLSDYLSEQLKYNYPYLSQLFSKYEHTTIEKYFIALKIERVKELLEYDQLTLTEIAYQLQYSSVQALSNQFKKITGLTASDYKGHPTNSERRSWDSI